MIRPLRNYIIVKREAAETTSALGIIIPEAAQKSSDVGTVVAAGPGNLERGERVPLDVEVGDRVMFAQFTGKEVEVDGEPMLMMVDTDCYGVME
jgi:chaperonin GroES